MMLNTLESASGKTLEAIMGQGAHIYLKDQFISMSGIGLSFDSVVTVDSFIITYDGKFIDFTTHQENGAMNNLNFRISLQSLMEYDRKEQYGVFEENGLDKEIDECFIVLLNTLINEFRVGGIAVKEELVLNKKTIVFEFATEAYFPLAHPQKRIFYTQKIYEESVIFNIGGYVLIDGLCNMTLLKKAFEIFIAKNPSIRCQITLKNKNAPHQYTSNHIKVFEEHYKNQKIFFSHLDEVFKKPLDLMDSPLFYFECFTIETGESGYIAFAHHIVSDGWSFKILTDHVTELYESLLKGEPINDKVEYSYFDYLEKEKKYLISDKYIEDKGFWLEYLRDLPMERALTNRIHQEIKGKRMMFQLERNDIDKFLVGNRISINTFFVALVILDIYNQSGMKDILVGMPVLNRSGKNEKKTFGMYVSTIPFRVKLENNLSYTDFVQLVGKKIESCFFHQKYPFDSLLQDIQQEYNFTGSLFDISVNYYAVKYVEKIAGFPQILYDWHSGEQIIPINFVIVERNGQINIQIDHMLTYSDEMIKDMFERIKNLIDNVMLNPKAMIM